MMNNLEILLAVVVVIAFLIYKLREQPRPPVSHQQKDASLR